MRSAKTTLPVLLATLAIPTWVASQPAQPAGTSPNPNRTTEPLAPRTAPPDRPATPAGTNAANTRTSPAATPSERVVAGDNDKAQLEAMLKTATSRQDIASKLEQAGWRVSSINEDDSDEIEYEIVKGSTTYEVQAEFADNGARVQEVEVNANLWRASSTKQMMEDPNYRHSGALTATPESRRYSDSRYQSEWTNEKANLEKALGPNLSANQYQAKLQEMGYKVTSVNERENDHVEYEIVKGDQSYEVQIEMNPATKLGRSIDVSTNMWETEATERQKKTN